jgi:hypothetical protein
MRQLQTFVPLLRFPWIEIATTQRKDQHVGVSLIQMANRALNSVYKASRGTSSLIISGATCTSASGFCEAHTSGWLTNSTTPWILLFNISEHVGFAWELKEDLRDLYRLVEPQQARDYLNNCP